MVAGEENKESAYSTVSSNWGVANEAHPYYKCAKQADIFIFLAHVHCKVKSYHIDFTLGKIPCYNEISLGK